MSEVFWMVYGFATPATKQYNSRQEARDEAARLCRKHGTVFYVLEAVDAVELDSPPVKIRDLTVAF